MNEIRKIPFFRLLLPLLGGIVAQYYLSIHKWGIILILFGILIMLLSYLVNCIKEYRFRWLFGFGVYICLFSVGICSTWMRQYQTVMPFSGAHEVYEGVVLDLPQQKPNTIALKVRLKTLEKQVVCYLPKDSLSRKLEVGDSFTFFSKIEPFPTIGNVGNFDYARYMYNQGFAGFTFIASDRWEKIDNQQLSLSIIASKSRKYILNFYRSLDLIGEEYALLSGLTLGHKDELPDELLQSFRTTGTAHILAVSGLHVGIIYVVIVALLGCFPRNRYKPLIIILLLWSYAFVVGLPPSAIRACIMLSLFCVGQIFYVKTYSYNTMFAAAFCILVWNPFLLFDLGFQLSFVAVLSIVFLMPFFLNLFKIKNRLLRSIWSIFSLSLSAQIGILPLCLYYFGTFPTYFLITNLLIVPLVTFAIYNAFAIIIVSLIETLLPGIPYMTDLPIALFRITVNCMTSIVRFFEELPYASIQNIEITSYTVFILWLLISSMFCFFIKKNSKNLLCGLSCCLVLILFGLVDQYKNQNTLIVHNKPKSLSITYQIGFKKNILSDLNETQLLYLNGQKYLILLDDKWSNKIALDNKIDIDYLHLDSNCSVSLYSLSQLFNIKKVVLGGQIPRKMVKRIITECEKLRIPYYDVYSNGNLKINF